MFEAKFLVIVVGERGQTVSRLKVQQRKKKPKPLIRGEIFIVYLCCSVNFQRCCFKPDCSVKSPLEDASIFLHEKEK